ncbi:hypothetical protein [Thalassotalea mangrovi]|uniref:Uncharacterized protein n=1 Tax=Thalassotalea mangrovi TaxID=2572245 RepID=A0A4U1B1R4_9GAMM|nr:hypothetical protein [Thalassotalea mangrovi]TKB43140.1 hypothetical protein E8M12_15785 [Thalassotalea mangrovi]
MLNLVWPLLGIGAAIPLLLYAQKFTYPTMQKILGTSLVVAAFIYIGFGLVWGDFLWLMIEVAGVAIK